MIERCRASCALIARPVSSCGKLSSTKTGWTSRAMKNHPWHRQSAACDGDRFFVNFLSGDSVYMTVLLLKMVRSCGRRNSLHTSIIRAMDHRRYTRIWSSAFPTTKAGAIVAMNREKLGILFGRKRDRQRRIIHLQRSSMWLARISYF